ncbi:MAG: branched-chain amino acid ABC transporter permease [Thaumarchaeota archaeon]|nr:branched-chain amino acid ABC transporter permease [Nitrososphaerota archaeon]
MSFDYVGFAIAFTTVYGIYSMLGVSLNLEYGYAGQPNFGQVLFYAIGAYVAGTIAANLLPMLAGVATGNICDVSSLVQREAIAIADPVISVSVWVLALIFSMAAGGIIGLVVSYPALRVKEEWFLSMILLVAGEMFRIFVQNTQQVGCGFNGLAGIVNPLNWIEKYFPGSQVLQAEVPSGLYAGIVLALAIACFLIAQRIGNSPYGRLLKSIRDDKVASESLGKDVSKVRKQIMIIGSIMAGLAGALYVYYIGTAVTDDYIPAVTFSIWVMMILGGYANNRGLLVGAFVITMLDRGSLVLGVLMEGWFPNFNPSLLIYARYMVESVVLILLLVFRQKGLFPETRIKTKAYTLFDFGASKAQGKKEPVTESLTEGSKQGEVQSNQVATDSSLVDSDTSGGSSRTK